MSELPAGATMLEPAARPDAESVDWLEEAGALEEQLLRQARRTQNGEVIWLHRKSFQEGQRQPVRLGPHLYDGVTGIALFLAAMERVEPRPGRRECIFAVLAPVRRQLVERVAHAGTAGDARYPLGGFSGLGGYIYSALLIGRWLGEPELIAEAAEIATLISPERIAADDDLDVMSGCAGAALALLALDRVSPAPVRGMKPLERAAACGEHLLARRAVTDVGPRAWPARAKPPGCGFAHGAAGIADCLARLFERTGEVRFREAAEEGIAFERFHYDPERGDWPVLGLPTVGFMNSWCNGAPGIALGRLGLLALGNSEHVREDLEAALRTTSQSSQTAETLCCGRMGNVEVLLHAHEALGGEHLLHAAETIASRVVSSSRDREGRYSWLIPGDRFAPSFFRGAAGVAYTFLRLAQPSLLPCVLSLEARTE